MFYDEEGKCPVCGSPAERTHEEFPYWFVTCPACGRFKILKYSVGQDELRPDDADKLASYLYYNGRINKPLSDYRFFNFIGAKEIFEKTYLAYPWCYHVTKDIINNWYPKTFSEKVDMFLLGLSSRSNFIGELILFTPEQEKSACFVIRKPEGPMRTYEHVVDDQVDFFIDYLIKQGYIAAESSGYIIQPKGLERIDVLQKSNAQNTKNVFVAMSFASDMKDVRYAIKDALVECGYNPRIMDEIEHNHQIVPEMLYEIREARFVIAELTGHNNGAYFEAGYALGHGKEVIQVCQKAKFGEDGHFDVKQVNTILWDTTEDLTSRLIARIKATIT